MTTAPSPILLLDVMDTLVYDPYLEMPDFFGLTLEELYSLADGSAWQRFERGEIDQQAFLDAFLPAHIHWDQQAFLELFQRGYRWLEGVEDLLAELKRAGIEMHCMSNYPCWFQTIENKLKLSQYLPWTFVSCKSGLRKPAAAAYLHAAESLSCLPSQCLFIDNTARNCAGARAVGMDAILFDDATKLRTELCRRGVLDLNNCYD